MKHVVLDQESWASLDNLVEGDTVLLLPGTYEFKSLDLPAGVSIVGANLSPLEALAWGSEAGGVTLKMGGEDGR